MEVWEAEEARVRLTSKQGTTIVLTLDDRVSKCSDAVNGKEEGMAKSCIYNRININSLNI